MSAAGNNVSTEMVCPLCGAPDDVVACDNLKCPGTAVPVAEWRDDAQAQPDRIRELEDQVASLSASNDQRGNDLVTVIAQRDAAERGLAQAAPEPVGWFQYSDYHGWQQVAKEYEGGEGQTALYASPQPVSNAYTGAAWSASTHDEIIKRLMTGIGMPNSASLYTAFKQFANELHALAHAEPQPSGIAYAARDPDAGAWNALIEAKERAETEAAQIRDATIEECAAIAQRWADEAKEFVGNERCEVQHNVCRSLAQAIRNRASSLPSTHQPLTPSDFDGGANGCAGTVVNSHPLHSRQCAIHTIGECTCSHSSTEQS